MARRLGLVIGANQYQDPTFCPLQSAEGDAQAVAQWLVNTKGGQWAPGNVQHVKGAYATRELVGSLITQLSLQVAEPGDLIFIYFAGHAFVDESSGAGFLALPNTQYRNPATGIHVASLLQNTLLRSRAAHAVLVLDCFQIGKAWNAQRTSPYDSRPLLGPQLYAALQNTSDRLILCSCRGNEFAPEQTQHNLGLFVYQLIVGLSGPVIDPATGIITLQQTYNYLLSTTDEQQRPQLFGQEQSPTVLVGDLSADADMPFSKAEMEGRPTQSPMPSGAAQPAANVPFAAATMQRTATGKLQLNAQMKQRYNQLMNQAQQLLQAQRFPDAFAAVEQALQIVPNDVPALVLKVQILGAGGRSQDAFATIEQLMRADQNNAKIWSVYAQLLSSGGQMQQALEAIERSLALDPQNPEAYAIKNEIMGQLAMIQSNSGTLSSRLSPLNKQPQQVTFTTYALVFILQALGLLVGTAGILLLELQHLITNVPGPLLIALGLLLLGFNAWRATYRYGLTAFIPIVVAHLLLGTILGAIYKFGLNRVNAFLKLHPTFFMPIPFIGGWLAAATVISVIVVIVGLIARSVAAKKGT
ncbi:MAG TPA: tetratricopeptide repeat protein [Ktedonobacteraceae bacterium]